MTQGWGAGDWLPWTVAVPLIAAVADFLLGGRARGLVTMAALAALAAVILGVAGQVLGGGTLVHALGGWGAPLGIALRADGLSALMLLMSGGVGAVVSVYALGYFEPAHARHFWPLWWFLWASLNALFLSADIFNLYVTLELLGLAAVGLVALNGEPSAVRAALRYLFAALVGSSAYLLGVALLYGAHGTLALAELAGAVAPGLPASLALALMTGGMLLKTALFPLHFWLPPAHGAAAAPVSALLSGLVVKASFYLMLRLWFEVFPAAVTAPAAQFVGALAAAAILWGGWLALRQRRLKMLVAWSTVAQVGYLFLLFPLAEAAIAEAWQGGVYQALSHAFAKSAMFLAAGCFIQATAADDTERLNGISARLPIALFAFALAGVSLMGLPPSGGFVAKWLLLRAAAAAGLWWWAAVILAGGLLTAAYVFRVLRRAFLPPPHAQFRPVPRALELAAFLLALVSIALGLNATAALSLLAIDAPYVTGLAP